MNPRLLICALTAAILLTSACATSPAPPPDPSQTVAPATPEASASATQAAFAVPWEPVPCDVGRELTDVERRYMTAPGPGGLGASVEEQVRALEALNPVTPEQWAEGILWVTNPGLAETFCDIATFEVMEIDLESPPPLSSGGGADSPRFHVAIVLDASGSMRAEELGATRMSIAKQAIREFVDDLPEGVSFSLRIHGHEGSNTDEGKQRSCASSELVHQGGKEGFLTALEAVEPGGWTPLASAIADAAADIPEHAEEAIVYVVSDGKETCDGDPLAEAEQLATTGVQPVINVVGFAVPEGERAALEEIAVVGDGAFAHASSPEGLSKVWEARKRELEEAWQEWAFESWRHILEASGEQQNRFHDVVEIDDTKALVQRWSNLEGVRSEVFENHDLTHEERMRVSRLTHAGHWAAHDYIDEFERRYDEVRVMKNAALEELEAMEARSRPDDEEP